MTARLWGFLAVLVVASTVSAQDADEVKGRVVDANGKPVAGAEVSPRWIRSTERGIKKDGQQHGYESALTDSDGRFTVPIHFYGRDQKLMAIDAAGKRGGVIALAADPSQRKTEIQVGPLVRVHGRFESREAEPTPPGGNAVQPARHTPTWVNTIVSTMPGKGMILENDTRDGEIDFLLPFGEYSLFGYGTDVNRINRTFTLSADTPGLDLDLGLMNLPPTFLARYQGRELPPWTVAEARGVPKEVTLADFRGKWVLVDFWGYWCGPCVRELGETIDFVADHAADQGKFAILAYHDGSVKDFSEMDAKLEQTKKTLWHGRDLPFPILLDTANEGKPGSGVTTDRWEIQGFPTTILVDPEGKLVGRANLETLAEKLTPVALPIRVARAFDRDVAFGFETISATEIARFLAEETHVPITLDEPAIQAAAIDPKREIPLTLSASLSLRSWFDLALTPSGLEAVATDAGISIRPIPANTPPRPPSAAQTRVAARLDTLLNQPISFDFANVSLGKVVAALEEKTEETFVLDPADRMAGRIDPATPVTGKATDQPARAALEALLAPLGIRPVVRAEAIVLTRPATP